MRFNENCLAHVSYDEVIETPMTNQVTAREFLEFVSKVEYSGPGASIDMRGDRSFLKSAKCRCCGKMMDVYKPSFRLFIDDLFCDYCKAGGVTRVEHEELDYISDISLKDGDNLLDMFLDGLGFPKLHILAVRDAQGNYKYYELSGDIKNIMPNIGKG
jgi:adenylyltransferase/sulfurtransferase